MMQKGVLLTLCLFTGLSAAEVYRWTDADGKVHFGDKPPAGGAAPETEVIDEESLSPDNTFEPQHEDYQGTGTDYLKREKRVKAERKARRLRREKEQAAAEKKQRNCRNARDNYRRFNLVKKRAESLAALMKQRQRRDNLKARIKRYCY